MVEGIGYRTRDPDFKDPAAEATAVAGLVGNGQVAMIDGAGHYPAAESVTADVVLAFPRSALARPDNVRRIVRSAG